jgi:hypothetical protein
MTHRTWLLATVALVSGAGVSGAQATPQKASSCTSYQNAPTSSTGAADPKDVASENAIIAALYDVISGPACQHRDWNRFRSLFAPGAQRTLEENGFFEHEISRTGETFGSITHAFSTYESRRKANDEKPFARGINSIQLLNDGTRWWVVTVYWQSERPDNPIPEQFLKKPGR